MTPLEFRAARESLGLTQPAMGKALGISTRQVQRLESGEQGISGPIGKLVRLLIGSSACRGS